MSAGISSHNSKGVPLDCKASGSSDNSKLWDVRETRKPFDTTPHKVHEIPFNCQTGNYRIDLVDELRKFLSFYNPRTSKEWEAVVRVLLYPTRSQDEDSKLDIYINWSDVYSNGVGF
uniref:Uncharacterized protein n=1 Tax=Tanacetum cinerariifolium TaxID=118510 RepID=A0A699GNP0_TANCI|nr:hypothetical protein [Tanacetum cinerariifolium]